jgi:hypothetical protein
MRLTMKFLLPMILAALLTLPAHAGPFAQGNPKIGEELHGEKCLNCHDTEVYSRKDRKIKTAEQLAARISICNVNTQAGWFPEEEQHVGAYLNQQFYKFK